MSQIRDREMALDDRYEKLSLISKGTFGSVWLGKKMGLENTKKFIIKEIPTHVLSVKEKHELEGVAQFFRTFKHPMLIRYYDYFKQADSIAIVMELAEGGTLENLIRDQKGVHFSEEGALKYFTQILLGLDFLHSRNVIHRNLSTKNILLNRKQRMIKLSDFGMPKQNSNACRGASMLNGSSSYMSPEMVEGRPCSYKADVWALGCVLYELLMLRRVFDGDNLPHVVRRITKLKYSPLGKHVSEGSAELVGKLLSLNEEDRPAVKEILADTLIIKHTLNALVDTGRIMGMPKKSPPTPPICQPAVLQACSCSPVKKLMLLKRFFLRHPAISDVFQRSRMPVVPIVINADEIISPDPLTTDRPVEVLASAIKPSLDTPHSTCSLLSQRGRYIRREGENQTAATISRPSATDLMQAVRWMDAQDCAIQNAENYLIERRTRLSPIEEEPLRVGLRRSGSSQSSATKRRKLLQSPFQYAKKHFVVEELIRYVQERSSAHS